MEIAIDRAAFRAWLVKREHKFVGRPGRTASCPLATYLRAKYRCKALHVAFMGGSAVACFDDDPNGFMTRLDQWATDFAEAFDKRSRTGGDVALSVLDGEPA